MDGITEINVINTAKGSIVPTKQLDTSMFEEDNPILPEVEPYRPEFPQYIPTRLYLNKDNVDDQQNNVI